MLGKTYFVSFKFFQDFHMGSQYFAGPLQLFVAAEGGTSSCIREWN